MIISVDSEKKYFKNPVCFYDKSMQQTRNKGTLVQPNKGKTYWLVYLLVKYSNLTKRSVTKLYVNILLEVLFREMRHENEIIGIQKIENHIYLQMV